MSDGVIGRPACGWLEIWGAALQADGEARSTFGASSIRRRSTAWTHSAGLDVSVAAGGADEPVHLTRRESFTN